MSFNLEKKRSRKKQTLSEKIYDQLLRDVTTGKLAPGQKLVIDRLAEELGVSITPIREALSQLQEQGLVKNVPYSGMFVSELSIDELEELFALRGVLEGYATKIATNFLNRNDLDAIEEKLHKLDEIVGLGDVEQFREHNRSFHQLIMKAYPGNALGDILTNITRNTERYRAVSVFLDQNYLETAQADHYRLFAFVRDGEAEKADALMREHAMMFANYLKEYLEEQSRENN